MRILTLIFILSFVRLAPAQVSIAYDAGSQPVAYGVRLFQIALAVQGQTLTPEHDQKRAALPDISVCIRGRIPGGLSAHVSNADFDEIGKEGFGFRNINGGRNLLILAIDEVGAMYALLDLEESSRLGGSWRQPRDKVVNPSLEYRILKFNLPWSPYRRSAATDVHLQTCRDLQFWERFLDMMAQNRFNVLSLWNNHPFPYMIRPANFPKATPFTDDELREWQHFWKSLFRMARQRGIQTFIVNWNIVVSPEFVNAYGGKEYNDLSDRVKQYTRESVTQLINEYDDLTGIGVTLADWMGNFDRVEMTPQKREEWIAETFIRGMKDARRPVKFLHRSVLAGDPMAMRKVIDDAALPEPALVEIKFNWSHGHSIPSLAITHDYHSGKLDERFWHPRPRNYNIQWMIRNEDFFILRWGSAEFIRRHLEINRQPHVNGYFIGSEGYIPALDYSHIPAGVKTWQYAFEKQWLFYKLWGRLLYDHRTPDRYFAAVFDARYGKNTGTALLEAFRLASNMPLRLAAFHRSTWDYTLYAEGFCAPEPSAPGGFFDRTSPFISIDELIYHETLDSNMLSIPDYVGQTLRSIPIAPGRVTPLMLADSSEQDSRRALAHVASLRPKVDSFSGALASELDDASTWAYLGLYFADKLRAGVALEMYRRTGQVEKKQEAVELLKKCVAHWDQVVTLTAARYLPTPHVSTERYGPEFATFSWQQLRDQVARDVKIAAASVHKK